MAAYTSKEDLHDDKLLDLGVHHVLEGVGGVLLELLEVARPGLVDPVDLADYPGSRHLQVQPGLGELQGDAIQDLLPWLLVPVPALVATLCVQ